MTFTTFTFVLFLVLVFALYWSARVRTWQNGLLVVASYFFYGWWDWRFCSLMFISSMIDFIAGQALSHAQRPGFRRAWLTLSIVCNLGLLGVFKYFNFFADSFAAMAQSLGWSVGPTTLNIILPVGISFYTFQTMSYTIDIYRRQLAPTKDVIEFFAFVSFFPQLVAGPIERASNLLPQFSKSRVFDHAIAVDGCRQMLWGFAKKMILADNLARFVDHAYSDVGSMTGPQLALATVLFAFQIYCDFSAYSDIAIGTAKLFGITLMRNFAYPYFSQSIGEFWRRWHISLSTWFRDYVYIPLGGSRVSKTRRAGNVLTTFVLSGLWHGASWNFVFWGGINGAGMLAPQNTGNPTEKRKAAAADVPGGESNIPRPITLVKIMLTFAFICVTWVFFRAATFGDALTILRRIASQAFSPAAYHTMAQHIWWTPGLLFTLVLLSVFVLVEWIQRRRPHPLALDQLSLPARWGAYTLLIWSTLILAPANAGQFIYFQF